MSITLHGLHLFWGQLHSNLTFIFDLNYFLWKLKSSKSQGVSFLLETKHKVLRVKTKPIPRMPVQDAKSNLRILVTNAQLSFADRLVVISEAPKIWGSLFSSFGVLWGLWGLKGLCFQDTRQYGAVKNICLIRNEN